MRLDPPPPTVSAPALSTTGPSTLTPCLTISFPDIGCLDVCAAVASPALSSETLVREIAYLTIKFDAVGMALKEYRAWGVQQAKRVVLRE